MQNCLNLRKKEKEQEQEEWIRGKRRKTIDFHLVLL